MQPCCNKEFACLHVIPFVEPGSKNWKSDSSYVN